MAGVGEVAVCVGGEIDRPSSDVQPTNGGGPGNTVYVSSPAGVTTRCSSHVSRKVLDRPRTTPTVGGVSKVDASTMYGVGHRCRRAPGAADAPPVLAPAAAALAPVHSTRTTPTEGGRCHDGVRPIGDEPDARTCPTSDWPEGTDPTPARTVARPPASHERVTTQPEPGGNGEYPCCVFPQRVWHMEHHWGPV
jgi:hypothetical protein